MQTVLLILGVIACPLMMFAMGGIAWTWAKLRGSPAQHGRGTQPDPGAAPDELIGDLHALPLAQNGTQSKVL
jgi:hypothetical protein